MNVDDDIVINDAPDARVDVSSGSDQRRQKNKRIAKELAQERDLLEVVSTQAGMRVLWRLLSDAGVYADAFRGSGRGEDTAYVLGRQAWGRQVLAALHRTQPLREAYVKMQNEASKHGW